MIIIMGMPGSGKSTQAALLSEHLKCAWLSSGQLLREQNDSLNNQTMASGKLVDDKTMFDLLENKLRQLNWRHSEIVMEGFPRNLAQAEWLADKVEMSQTFITSIININISKDRVISRMLARGRPDDSAESISRRFEEYETRFKPILTFLMRSGMNIHQIEGEGSIEEIQAAIRQALKS